MDEDEEARFDAELILVGDKKISVLKLVREVLSIGIEEAKAFIESVPRTLKRNISRDEGEALERRFDAVGAYLVLRSSPRG
ncbi:MAG: ribosomal protein L7/L12 [Alphaproteobacteria bacterium]|nr:ribosomal protein L7/L12 [Alphaproteobacteria bacterium]